MINMGEAHLFNINEGLFIFSVYMGLNFKPLMKHKKLQNRLNMYSYLKKILKHVIS